MGSHLCPWRLKEATRNSNLIVFLLWFLAGSLRLAQCGLVGLSLSLSLYIFSKTPFLFIVEICVWLVLYWVSLWCIVCGVYGFVVICWETERKMEYFWKFSFCLNDFLHPNRAVYWFCIGFYVSIVCGAYAYVVIMLRNWGESETLMKILFCFNEFP